MTKDINNENPLLKAAEVIKKGGIVVFPTETVYGLGADATNVKAVKKIFKAKGRSMDNPLIVHIADKKDLKKIVDSVPVVAKKLIDKFWPGPLTILFKKNSIIPSEVTAGLDTVAVRLPNHALARALIREAGVPIAAPSANISGKPSPTEASHAKKDLSKKVDFTPAPLEYTKRHSGQLNKKVWGYILSAERSKHGIESTVINVLVKPPVILRQGAVTQEEIEKVIGKVNTANSKSQMANGELISPGMRYRHYAPKARLILPDVEPRDTPKAIGYLIEKYQLAKKRVGVLGTRENYQSYKKANRVIILGSGKNLSTCAANLFKSLRDFDRFNDVDIILSETFLEKGIGAAIMERLRKAAS